MIKNLKCVWCKNAWTEIVIDYVTADFNDERELSFGRRMIVDTSGCCWEWL